MIQLNFDAARRRWVNRYRSLRTENRFMSAVLPESDAKSGAQASVAKGHGGGRREPVQRPVMMAGRFCRSITRTTLAFERGFPAKALDVHLQDRGVVHEPKISGNEASRQTGIAPLQRYYEAVRP